MAYIKEEKRENHYIKGGYKRVIKSQGNPTLESLRETFCNRSPMANIVLTKNLSKRTKRFPKTKSPKVHQQKP